MASAGHLQKISVGLLARTLHNAVTGQLITRARESLVRAACECVALLVVAALLPWDNGDARAVAVVALLAFLCVDAVRRLQGV